MLMAHDSSGVYVSIRMVCLIRINQSLLLGLKYIVNYTF
jgi:hypothetical protein